MGKFLERMAGVSMCMSGWSGQDLEGWNQRARWWQDLPGWDQRARQWQTLRGGDGGEAKDSLKKKAKRVKYTEEDETIQLYFEDYTSNPKDTFNR